MTHMTHTIDPDTIATTTAHLDQARHAAADAAAAVELAEETAQDVKASVSSSHPPTVARLTRVDAEVELARGRAQRARALLSAAERSVAHEVPLAAAVADVLAAAFPFLHEITIGMDEHHRPTTVDSAPVAVVAQPRPSYHDQETGALTSNRWADDPAVVVVKFYRPRGFALLDVDRLYDTASKLGLRFLKRGHKRELADDPHYLRLDLDTLEGESGAVDTLRVAVETFPEIPALNHGGQAAAQAWLAAIALEGERPTQQRRGPWASGASSAVSGAGDVASKVSGDVRTTRVRGNVTIRDTGSATPADVLGYVSRAAEGAKVSPVAGLGRATKVSTSLSAHSPGSNGISVDVAAEFVAADPAA
ncbi:hypothetical protein [Microlunatus antarcticus]|uniref:Uncharacterized protein n=1 Tax=Microlunatus antarcticus TaxID=53388 RepID=A0A7W5P5I2_9ACTN|nr:hypothetical protein [Microlunatus antarcticus]MBB3325489.1 hypothetical protein [Microlunatus antarcticus]